MTRTASPLLLAVPFVLALTAQVVAHANPTLLVAVDKAVAHLQAECAKQQVLMPPLLTAISNRDMSAARTAYVAARPPYEQIEVNAHIFPQLDADIDARPYAFDLGEDSIHFRGFHFIERALYRDQHLRDPELMAIATRLNQSVNALCAVLNDRSKFAAVSILEGALTLAYEVPAKKISSEEEAWSDLSLMIFRNNWQGVWSQVSPFLDTSVIPPAMASEARNAYMAAKRIYNNVDPKNNFETSAGTARPFSNITTAERASLQSAAYRLATAVEAVHDAVVADETHDSDAPSGDDEAEEEDDEDSSDGLHEDEYKAQVRKGIMRYLTLCRKQQWVAKKMQDAIASGDLSKAQMAYAAARPPYEQIEVLAGDFPDLDEAIDQRPYVQSRDERDAGWRGMHEVERALYRDADLAHAASATKVVRGDVDSLCEVLRAFVEDGKGPFSAGGAFDGMTALSYEVPAKKIASEEETWSDLSVMIFRENAKGIWAVAEPFVDVLPKAEGTRLRKAYFGIRDYIKYVVDPKNDYDEGIDFVKYSAVPVWQRKDISDLFYEYVRAIRAARKAL